MADPLVGILGGSPSDLPMLQQATAILERLDIPHEIHVMSAHRTPDLVDEYARTAEERGLVAVICGAGRAAHLAGADALYSTVQMPRGVPVATVGIDGAVNAALLAAQILAVRDPEVRVKLHVFKESLDDGLKL